MELGRAYEGGQFPGRLDGGQAAQAERVDQLEDRRVGADAERQVTDRHGGEARIEPELLAPTFTSATSARATPRCSCLCLPCCRGVVAEVPEHFGPGPFGVCRRPRGREFVRRPGTRVHRPGAATATSVCNTLATRRTQAMAVSSTAALVRLLVLGAASLALGLELRVPGLGDFVELRAPALLGVRATTPPPTPPAPCGAGPGRGSLPRRAAWRRTRAGCGRRGRTRAGAPAPQGCAATSRVSVPWRYVVLRLRRHT